LPFGFSPKFLKKSASFFKFKSFWIHFGETIHVHTRQECILYRKEGKQQIKFGGVVGGGGRGGMHRFRVIQITKTNQFSYL
jgi:hypothetical protein